MTLVKKNLLRAIAAALAIILCALGAATIPAAVRSAAAEEAEIVSSYPYTTVTKVKVNLRTSKSVNSALKRTVPAGAEITVFSKDGNWAYVQYGKEKGYMRTEYIVLKTVKKITVTPTPTPAPTLAPEENAGGYQILRRGDEGRHVRALQEALIELGFLTGKADGKFGDATLKAVVAFQQKNEYPDTGLVDANLQAFLYTGKPVNSKGQAVKIKTLSPVDGVTIRLNNTGFIVGELQEKLKKLGYYGGPINNVYDTATRNAVITLQRKYGLKVDGLAGAQTRALVDSGEAVPIDIKITPTPKPTATPTPKPTWEVPNRKVETGSTGADVKTIQKRLKELGYYRGSVDGKFGRASANALKSFQTNNGLKADGVAGTKTYEKLFSEDAVAFTVAENEAKATAAPKSLKRGSTGSAVKTLQTILTELGYLKGRIDGIFGSKTAAAVKAFQKASKLTVDGIAGTKTMTQLNKASEAANATPTPKPTATPTPVPGAALALQGSPAASRVIYANWYTTVRDVCKKYPYATVYDYSTGISWQVHIFSVGAHADFEPVTAADTLRMQQAFGGETTWNPKPVWVIFSDGSVYMGSTHDTPHGTSHNTSNNFGGHACIHFPRTQAQVEAIGPYATSHQEAIDKGWAVTRRLAQN